MTAALERMAIEIAMASAAAKGVPADMLAAAAERSWRLHLPYAHAAIRGLRYADGIDEDIAIRAGRRIQSDPVLAIECVDEWLDAVAEGV